MTAQKLQHLLERMRTISPQSYCNAFNSTRSDPEVMRMYTMMKRTPLEYLDSAQPEVLNKLIRYLKVNERIYPS